MMYMVFIIDHIHHSLNESKMLIFACKNDMRVYFNVVVFFFILLNNGSCDHSKMFDES
jgi:hypothetical protein